MNSLICRKRAKDLKQLMPRLWPHFLFLAMIPIMIACGPSGSPERAVVMYIEALVEADSVRAVNLACTAWEEQARMEADSFETVEAKLEGLVCTEGEQAGEFTIVTCQGVIRAMYEGELQDLNLDRRAYQVMLEDGEWRMCGYK